jgi:hypothetical protein
MWTFYWTTAGALCSGSTAAAACTMFNAAALAVARDNVRQQQHEQQQLVELLDSRACQPKRR